MTPENEPHRRALLILYRRYLAAERDWQSAQRDARSWFPADLRQTVAPIGDPGSRIRRLYERRDRTVEQLEIVLLKLHAAQGTKERRAICLSLPQY